MACITSYKRNLRFCCRHGL